MKINKLVALLTIALCSTAGVSANANVIQISEVGNGLSISFTLPTYTVRNDTLPEFYGVREVFSTISVDSGDFSPWGEVGFPMLPQYTFDVNVPSYAAGFIVELSNPVTQVIRLDKRITPLQDRR